MKLTHVRLCVDDLPACIAFYRDVLGLTAKFDHEGTVYVEFETGTPGMTIGLFKHELMQAAIGKPHDNAQKVGERVLLTFYVKSVDAAFAELKAKGVTVASEPKDQPQWMIRVAHVRDPAGNLIELHQPLAGQKVD
jgi:lactoylglutathione lyase